MTIRLIPVLLILLGSLRIASTWTQFTQTYDEGFHIACGMQWWDDHRYTREYQHPPLARIAVAAGPYFAGARAKGIPDSSEEGSAILHEGGHYWRNLALARAGVLPFFWLACFAVWSIARRLYDAKVALAALAIFSFLPPVLGHSAIATTDVAAMATFAFAFDRLHSWFVKPTRWGVALAGLGVGLAIATKFSNILYLGIALIVLIVAYRRWLPIPLLLTIPIALILLTATYRFRKEFPDGTTPPMPPAATLADRVANAGSRIYNLRAFWYPAYKGIEEVRKHNAEGHYTFLLGRTYVGGDWRFFPVVMSVKTPLAVLALFLLVFNRRTTLLVGLTVLFLAVLLFSNINLGVRHALHLYIPMSIAAGWGLLHLSRRIAVPLGCWLLVASAFAQPDYFTYFNEIAARKPEHFLAESDLDWGQDLPRLVKLLDQHRIATCRLAYWGQADYHRIYPGRFVDHPVWQQPAKGCVAVSARYLSLDAAIHVQKGGHDPWQWLRSQPQLGRAGGSIVVYNVP